MEKEYPHSFQLSWVVFVCVMLICFINCSANEVSDFDRQLRAIRYAERKDGTNPAILETECLNLIANHKSPADKGKIYSTIALIYSDRGYGPDDDPNIAAKAFQYSMKALEYPLEPLAACNMYTRAADAIVVHSSRDPNMLIADVREEAFDLCLKGLKIALDNEAPKEYPKPPEAVGKISKGPGTPLEQVLRWQNHQVEAREKWLYEIEFCGLRQGLFQRCISLSSRRTNDQDQFEKKVRQILKVYQETADELIAAFHVQIARHESD